MTHEIKNSVIPIATLAEVVNDMVSNGELSTLTAEDADDLVVSMRTIEKRSKGLVKFVTNYGDLAKVPKPDFKKENIAEILQEIILLEQSVAEEYGINLKVNLPGHPVQLFLDRELIEQVIINVIKNAIEAIAESTIDNPTINCKFESQPDQIVLFIQDNGPGMDVETVEQVFIPFFTTKSQGSGIGLSYSKQVMRAHKGNLRVKSTPGAGTAFELVFLSV